MLKHREENAVKLNACIYNLRICIYHLRQKIFVSWYIHVLHIFLSFVLPSIWANVSIWIMMTSSNGNIFRVTGQLCWEFTGTPNPQPPIPKGQWRGALMFSLICAWINGWVQQSSGWWFKTPSRPLWRHCNDISTLPVDSPHKAQWRGALIFSLIYAWTNGRANNRDAGDLRCHGAHYEPCPTLTVVQINRRWS